MTRTEKWRYKRLKLDCDRDILANALLNTSEKLMKVHSDMSTRKSSILDEQMDDPLGRLNDLMGLLKERKSFL